MHTPGPFPLLRFLAMNDIDVGIGRDAEHNASGKDIQQMNVRFGPEHWDNEREVLTDRQRIRDLETYVFGDSRGLTIGVFRQMRNHVVWLIVLSLLQLVTAVMMALSIWVIP